MNEFRKDIDRLWLEVGKNKEFCTQLCNYMDKLEKRITHERAEFESRIKKHNQRLVIQFEALSDALIKKAKSIVDEK